MDIANGTCDIKKNNQKKQWFNLTDMFSIAAIIIGSIWILSSLIILSNTCTHSFSDILGVLPFVLFVGLPGMFLLIFGIMTYRIRSKRNIINLSSCYAFAFFYLLFFVVISSSLLDAEENSTRVILGMILVSYIFQEYFKRFLLRNYGFYIEPVSNKALKVCSAVYSIILCSAAISLFPDLDFDYAYVNKSKSEMSITQFAFIPFGLFFMWVILYFIISRIAINLKDKAILKTQKIKEDNSP